MNPHIRIRQSLISLMIIFTLVISTGCSDKINRLFQANLPVIDDAPTSSQVEPADSATINSLGKW